MARFIALTALTGLPHHETRRERGRPSVLSRRQIHRMLENFRKTFPGFRAQSRIRRPERESRVACLTSRWRRHPFHRCISGPIYSGITQHSPSLILTLLTVSRPLGMLLLLIRSLIVIQAAWKPATPHHQTMSTALQGPASRINKSRFKQRPSSATAGAKLPCRHANGKQPITDRIIYNSNISRLRSGNEDETEATYIYITKRFRQSQRGGPHPDVESREAPNHVSRSLTNTPKAPWLLLPY